MTAENLTHELRDAATRFAARECAPDDVRRLRRVLPSFRPERWRAFAEQGWTSVLAPEEAGGAGLSLADAAAIAAALAERLAPEPFVPVVVLSGGILGRCPVGSQRDALLAGLCDGSALIATAWQEDARDDGTGHPRTTATRVAQGWRLDGDKAFVPGADAASHLLITADCGSELGLFAVAADTSGLDISHDFQVDGTAASKVRCRGLVVPDGDRLATGDAARSALAAALADARIVASSELHAVCARLLAMSLEHIRVRTQFGRPIGAFQALQHMAVDCATQIELCGAVVDEALAAGEAERPVLAARAKARAAAMAALVTRSAIQMHGAMGYTDASDVSLYVKRALARSAWLGGATSQRRSFAGLSPAQALPRPVREPAACPPQLRALPPDTDWNRLDAADFRALVRDFVETNYPEELRFLPRRVRWQEVRDWNLALSARGWIAPGWPREWGGMGLDPERQLIMVDEFERWGVGRSPDQGVRQLGPALLKHGTDAQRRAWLPKIISCEHIWCQGYSEPNAGSDLANVATTAVPDGDMLVINGQKTWTSLAADATHVYVLCRTDPAAKKQAGISFIIVDLTTPGITMRPIRDISGHEEFYEVFFDDVRVPAENMVGGLNNGWTVAKAVLEFERLGLGSPRRPFVALNALLALAHRLDLFSDKGFEDVLTALRMDVLDNGSLYRKYAEAARLGRLGPEVSMLKIWSTETFQRITEATLDWAGAWGGYDGEIVEGDNESNIYSPYYVSRMATIGGGTSEIQRNLVARQVLDLPQK